MMTRHEQATIIVKAFAAAVNFAVEQVEGGSIYHEKLQVVTVKDICDIASKIVTSDRMHEVINGGSSLETLFPFSGDAERDAIAMAVYQMGTFLDLVAGT